MRANDPVRVLRRTRHGFLTTAQLAQALGVRSVTAEAWLSMLASEGKVRREAHGWRAVYKGTQAVRQYAE